MEREQAIDEAVDDIIAGWPPGRFAAVMPAVRRFCELVVDERAAWSARPDPDVDLAAYIAAHDAILDLLDETLELGDILRIWPGEEREAPLRRN